MIKQLNEFLQKRNITYPCLLSAHEMVKNYLVRVYPTIYLIDQKGRIIYTKIGWGETEIKKLEKRIKKNLK